MVQTFMTHNMKDAEITALSTGRDHEFQRIMGAIERSQKASPGALQHVVLYGSRGFGKSFMARRVQVEIANSDTARAVVYLLLPEEQHNLQHTAWLDDAGKGAHTGVRIGCVMKYTVTPDVVERFLDERRMQNIPLDEFALGKVAGMRAGTIDGNGEVQPDQTPTVLGYDAGHSATAAARVQNGFPVE